MTALTILVPMEVHASTWSTTTSAFVEFHSLDVIVIQKWILVHQISVAMELDALQAQTIKTSTALVHLVMLVDYAMKTSTNVNFRLLLVAMAQPARTPTDRINVSALKATKEKIVQSTLTTALHSLVKTAALASTALAITLACATKVSKENIAKLTSTNVSHNRVKTARPAINT